MFACTERQTVIYCRLYGRTEVVIGVIGENCSGKSTLARQIKSAFGGEIITGKDYLRMAKSESEAERLFKEKLKNAVAGENVIFVISEKEHLVFLPDGAIKILVQTDLETIKQRFKMRMNGTLPPPVETMLERKHGIFDDGVYDFRFNGSSQNYSEVCTFLNGII